MRGKVVLIRTMADTVFGTAHFERALSMAGILTLALILWGVSNITQPCKKSRLLMVIIFQKVWGASLE